MLYGGLHELCHVLFEMDFFFLVVEGTVGIVDGNHHGHGGDSVAGHGVEGSEEHNARHLEHLVDLTYA